MAETKKSKKKDLPPLEDFLPQYNPPVMRAVPEFIECGNDTRISRIEETILPETPANKGQTVLDPFKKHEIKRRIIEAGHKANFKTKNGSKYFETFKVGVV